MIADSRQRQAGTRSGSGCKLRQEYARRTPPPLRLTPPLLDLDTRDIPPPPLRRCHWHYRGRSTWVNISVSCCRWLIVMGIPLGFFVSWFLGLGCWLRVLFAGVRCEIILSLYVHCGVYGTFRYSSYLLCLGLCVEDSTGKTRWNEIVSIEGIIQALTSHSTIRA